MDSRNSYMSVRQRQNSRAPKRESSEQYRKRMGITYHNPADDPDYVPDPKNDPPIITKDDPYTHLTLDDV
jgi:hypothetical protein